MIKKRKYLNCKSCKKSFWKYDSQIKKGEGKYCSKICRWKDKSSHPNWKDGISFRDDYQKIYYLKNKEKKIRVATEWNKENKERHYQSTKKYRIENKGKALFWKYKRRFRELFNGGEFTKKEWADLVKKFNFTCPACYRKEPEIKLTADHIIPVSKGGTNYILNIQPLCESCNKKKNAKIIYYQPSS